MCPLPVEESNEFPSFTSTFSTPTNIAVIKYWGKDNIELNTPLNSSVSVTLNQNDLKTVTTATASQRFTQNRLWINGEEVDITKSKRILTVIDEVLKLAGDRKNSKGDVIVRKEDWKKYHLHIVSKNFFPTAAGLASSASGYACLVKTLADVFCVPEELHCKLSTIARQGSGSACRSLYGGFVRWDKGTEKNGSDSQAIQIADENHWKELEAIICVVNDEKKDTSSTSGMNCSVQTSLLLGFRATSVVSKRLEAIEKAYLERDFETFAKITMQDSNQFHATCLDTYPPIFYLNDISRGIIQIIHKYNEFKGSICAAYTFDAGPNAVLFVQKQNTSELLALILRYFQPTGSNFVQSSLPYPTYEEELPKKLTDSIALCSSRGDVKMIYYTNVGDGPRKLSATEAITNEKINTTTHKKLSSTLLLLPSLLVASIILWKRLS